MSIVLSKTEFPNATIDQVPGATDHRREVPPKAVQPVNDVDKLIAKTADSVVAFIPKENFEVLPNASDDKYWIVRNATQTVEDYLKRRLAAHIGAAAKSVAELGCPDSLEDEGKDPETLREDLQQRLLNLMDAVNPKSCNIRDDLKKQLSLAYGTGCLIPNGRVLTCAHHDEVTKAHIVPFKSRFINNPGKFRVLLGYRNDDIKDGSVLPRWQVRDIERVDIIPWQPKSEITTFDLPKWYDVAILKLVDLPSTVKVPAIPMIPIATSPPGVFEGLKTPEDVFVIGCPSGMPLKYTSGRIINIFAPPGRSGVVPSRFSTTLEQFRGNSGSPVFRQRGGIVEICGVVSSGGRVSLASLPRSIKAEAKEAIIAVTGSDPSLKDEDYEPLYHSGEHSILCSADSKSFSFTKIFDDSANIEQNGIECRVDSVPILFSSLGGFAPEKSAQPAQAVSNYISLSIVVSYEKKVAEPITFGIVGPNGSIKATTNMIDGGNTTAYFFADFGIPSDRSSKDLVTTQLKLDLEDRALRQKVNSLGVKKFRSFIYDPEPAPEDSSELLENLSETDWDQKWKAYWALTMDKRKEKIVPGPLILGGWFGADNQPLATYPGYQGSPGMLGWIEPGSIWISHLPQAAKVTLRYRRGMSGAAASKVKYESFFFQGSMLFGKESREVEKGIKGSRA